MQSTWKLKNIKQIIVIWTIVILIIAVALIVENLSLKKALAEAKKPSLIELQKKELEDLESSWREAQKYCESKPWIEEKIHELRAKILWKNPSNSLYKRENKKEEIKKLER